MRATALRAVMFRLALVLGIVATTIGAVPADAASDVGVRPATYGVAVDKDVPITMSDGVVLDADVLRPALADGSPAPGRFPVILTQTPYNKNLPGTNFRDDFLITRGYVQVIVDVRGTGGSQGTWDSFGSREQRDGYELVRWVASVPPWSDGRVATYGISYGAINQFFTAAQQPPGLKAAFPIVPAGDVYRDVSMSGGQPDSGFIPLWLGLVTGAGLVPPAYTAQDPVRATGVLSGHLSGAGAFQLPTMLNTLSGDDLAYDGPFYRLRSPLEVVDKVRVPTFVVGGWYDLFQRSEPLLFQRLQRDGVPARLLMGPWEHAQTVNPPGLPAPGIPSLDAAALRWFDHYVRGVPDPTLDRDIAPVTYQELGSGRWRTARHWLDTDVHARTLQLDGPATPAAPGSMTTGTAGHPDPDRVLPVPVSGLCTRSASQWTGGVLALALGDTPCAQDQAADDATGTSYEIPVTRPLHLLGPVAANLFVATTARDGMIAARLEDVAPDGSVRQLTGGWQVLSLRALDAGRSVTRDGHIVQPYHPFTRDSAQPMSPGQAAEVWVELFPTGADVQPGHRLRVTFQSFDTPHLAPTLPQLAGTIGGVISIYHDAARPSQIVLPVRD
ncbi:CocE/NonD family hydrolase [Gandjariella thermophila]|uniref:CocE/NonD family hydrolase n=1 Tax=Gandjariella thermophila TaxID=1931992 RepID=UPI0018649F3F|nr:CocE/NonD family hydrolase [Gandjariella thermophila]